MVTNLIHNFIHTQNTPASKKEKPKFDIHHELKNKTFMRPLEGEGRLIRSNIFDAPAIMARSAFYDIKALNSAVKGEANDHQLGKLNDLGMKIGGLGIAGYLFYKRQTPMTKLMEFVGLGSFFASMALWPKIAIQIPARIIHGFNVQQQYEDSMGRKKPFFQDPQFLPWDLYSDEEINKIGDRMGIPRNIKNRREFIQEKMKKIAIQNNTLWMLTAGFATPVMSALICNQLEKPLGNFLSSKRNKQNNHLINHFKDYVPKHNTVINKVNKILSINQNQPLSEDLIKELANAMTENLVSRNATNNLIKDLEKLFETQNYVINSNSVNAIIKDSKKALKGVVTDEIIEQIVPTPEQLTRYFNDEKGYYLTELTPAQIKKIFHELGGKIRNTIDDYNKNNPQNSITEKQKSNIIKKLISQEKSPVMNGLRLEQYSVLSGNNQKVIRKIATAFNNLNNQLFTVEKYIFNQLGEAPETIIADYWNNTIDTIVKAAKIKPEQLEKARGDRLPVANLLKSSFDKIASDKTTYKAVLTQIASQISKINGLIKKVDVNDDFLKPTGTSQLDKLLDTIFNGFTKEIGTIVDLKAGEMNNILNELAQSVKPYSFPYSSNGTFKDLYKGMVRQRLLGVKSSFYRIINALDLHRRLALGDKEYMHGLRLDNLPRETKEEIVDFAKRSGISAHSADFFTKFFNSINADADEYDVTDIWNRKGYNIYRYFDEHKTINRIEMPQDKTLFESVMKLQYQDRLLSETEDILKPFNDMLTEFKKYRDDIYYKVGNLHYIEKIHHKTNTDGMCDLNDKVIFELLGAAPDEVFLKYGKQTFNTRKWLSIFGKTGGILLGVTVLAQFLFGKMKLPKPIPRLRNPQKEPDKEKVK